MKNIFFIVTFLIATSAYSQNWESLGNGFPPSYGLRAMYSDTVDNYLYATGMFFYQRPDGRTLKGIARWDGIKWDSLGAGIDGADTLALNNTFAFARYNNDLYVGGVFRSLGDKWARGIGIWRGTYWDTLAVQPFKKNFGSANVDVITVINNELYIGGIFDSINNVPCRGIAKWNGTTWTCLNMPPNIFGTPYVFSIYEYNNEIYVGGNFYSSAFPSDTIQDIIKYDGTSWQSVGGGLKGSSSNVASMVVYNNELYVSGYFSVSDGNHGNYIQKWNGSSWSDVGGGVIGNGGGNGQINKLLVHNNKLYAMGVFDIAGGIPAQYIASWDGTNWCGFGSSFDNIISTGCVYKDTLCVGGGFWTIDSDSMNFISKWRGGNFVDTCGNTTGINESTINIESLKVYPNPAQTKITIEFEFKAPETKNASIEIKNILGQNVKTINRSAFVKGINKIEIDVSEFSSGLYFVQVQSEKIIINKKFVKQ